MRCLYCGKELALLKRLTGGGDFCSEAHKQSYQEEYNRVALSRLLQAQKKKQQSSSPPADSQAPDSSIAVQEPVNIEHEKPVEAPVLALAVRDTSVSQAEDLATVEHQPEPSKEAGFQLELPASAAAPEPTPYLDPWIEMNGGVAASSSQIEKGSPELSSAKLLDLESVRAVLEPEATASCEVAPESFGGSPVYSSLSTPAEIPVTGNNNPSRLGAVAGAKGLLTIEVRPIPSALKPDYGFVNGLAPDTGIPVRQSSFLTLPPASIDWPADESEILLDSAHWDFGRRIDGQADDDSPRSSLEALSRLHQELVEQEFGSNAEPAAPEPERELVPTVAEAAVATIDVTAEEPEPSRPAASQKIFEIPIKAVAPPKPALVGPTALAPQTAPELPQMKAIPLRPKIALATDYAPSAVVAAAPAAQPVAPKTSAPPHRPTAQKSGSNPPQPGSSPQPPKPRSALAGKPAEPPKTVSVKAPAAEPSPQKPKAAAETPKPVEERPQSTPVDTKPPSPQTTAEDAVPSFGVAQRSNTSWLSSLKIKLALAIVFVAGAATYFVGWGGKTGKPAVSNLAVSGDGVGPSIIMGEGGWVENWGTDPVGMHAGREITIYRPSLKLSDYRLQFQASIDTKSIGWVFRAPDPSNYYAMKLMTVSTSLPLKVALFKYLVADGRQTQVGRVPIDLPVDADTVFDIRVDVRGPQFTTYIQGQQVDIWTDDQLKIGGAGFLNERDERAKVKSVSIRYLSGAK